MTLREKILQLITRALTADETILPQEDLDNITDIILRAEELSAAAVEIFGETGSSFISEVGLLIANLPAEYPLTSVFPQAVNLIALLTLANQLDPDQLEDAVPANIDAFTIREAKLQAFKNDGNLLRLFIYEHPANFKKSVALLDFGSGFGIDTRAANYPHKMAACVTIITGETAVDLSEKSWVIATPKNEKRRLFYCKYHLLLSGYLLTNPVFAPPTSALQGIADTLETTVKYDQFSEPFEILGEINSRTTVLDKFLSCYHVLENYMIRAQIVKVVGRSDATTLFGIRNFKMMELAVQQKEMLHLSTLITESWDKQIGGLTFREYANRCFQSLFSDPLFIPDDFHEFLDRLTVKSNGQQLNTQSLNEACAILPKLLYQVRCSIVHNKETEFHLSNRELDVVTVLKTLTDLCLPTMQRLAFGLPSVPAPNPLRYSKSELRLY
jgi:hypothetical protein